MTDPVDLGLVNPARSDPPAIGTSTGTPGEPPADPGGWRGRFPHGPLEAVGIHVRRGDTDILRGVDARALPGRPLALTGPSGSGKSTLLAVLGGLSAADRGETTFEGATIPVGDPDLRRSIGYVLQGYGLVGLLTARENVSIALRTLGVPANRLVSEAQVALDRVGLGDRADHLVEDMSGGQQQRVALARVLAARPAAVLADEPTAELDHETRDAILRLLVDYCTDGPGRVLVIATHDPDVAALCLDRVRLVDGRVAHPD